MQSKTNLTCKGNEKETMSDQHEDLLRKIPPHLHTMFTKASKDSNEQERIALADLLVQYGDTVSKHEGDLGRTHLAEHSIDVEYSKPKRQPPRRVPIALAAAEKQAIEKMKEEKIIRKSTSPWASPIVLVKKKSGGIRPCIDYRQVNPITRKDAFPLPRIQDCLDAVTGSILFSTLDLTSGCHQIPVKEEDIQKTAFITKYGLNEFTTMPFGLTNAPATFQRVMELALQGLQWQTCLIYLDDLIIFSSTLDVLNNRYNALRNLVSSFRQRSVNSFFQQSESERGVPSNQRKSERGVPSNQRK